MDDADNRADHRGRAVEWGLVNQCVPPARLMASAEELAQRIAQFNPIALSAATQAIGQIPANIRDLRQGIPIRRTRQRENPVVQCQCESFKDALPGEKVKLTCHTGTLFRQHPQLGPGWARWMVWMSSKYSGRNPVTSAALRCRLPGCWLLAWERASSGSSQKAVTRCAIGPPLMADGSSAASRFLLDSKQLVDSPAEPGARQLSAHRRCRGGRAMGKPSQGAGAFELRAGPARAERAHDSSRQRLAGYCWRSGPASLGASWLSDGLLPRG